LADAQGRNRLLTVIPLSAFLSLFHLVIDNPTHTETRDNLNFLDIAAGYFRRLEYVTRQDFPFSVLPKLASIAHEYVQTLPLTKDNGTSLQEALTGTTPLIGNDPVPEVRVGFDLHNSTEPGLSDSTVEHYQEAGNIPLYGMPATTHSGPERFSIVGSPLGADVSQQVQENEVMDFFGYLLDGTSSAMYGNSFSWQ
jgi:hypothetical protein